MIAVVIPTYNERENIQKLIELIFNLGVPNLRVIVVDDNSPDKTAETALKLAERFPIQIMQRKTKLGLGSAYIAGFKKALSAGAEFIFEMDADFSHDPNDIPRLLAAIGDADCVIGSRKIKGGKIIGWSWWRKFMSAGAMRISRFFLNLKTRDVTSGFRCYRRKVLETIGIDNIITNGYAFQEEMLFRVQNAGFKINEIPVTFIDRQKGKSKLSKRDILEFFWLIAKLMPKRFFAKESKHAF
ncbi:MAG: Dolichyl-phosphate beta-D-mannosyltransferase [Candidatus Magasanikbacteria bacterium GW2011_GWA2_46_17]|uniref:Dolichyl-phosphate beta-D-mannosyltransferase n=1 Tax=Candidatus Magasanikbacteria bacterium GW2011_GWA2_46_17 TaxID=1619042 RepID=A0A0G1P0K3_9BACT|nr:MAG: Dolichyl-phosphate beta-D-mannosyltransferase [Candidatus Magasanikbacteria bacterium GW2011_GWA2_46_17]